MNHHVMPAFDITLAMIEGTKVQTYCGRSFVPTVQVGTSGRPDLPGAPDCRKCTELRELTVKWNRLRLEKNRLMREMRAVEKQYRHAVEDESTRQAQPTPDEVSQEVTA
ncbi:hypothetical protein [Microbacterium album]|uniref:Uncharacterized protein n=1 Tax=Microbacterium album TaxID=2053191 RepID=A0A917MM50_9MICO|nr:hypothetical protein [Microbacterium album]GGH44990.1 hypothetical protein GCM10010921_20070 [Microbacterium album]